MIFAEQKCKNFEKKNDTKECVFKSCLCTEAKIRSKAYAWILRDCPSFREKGWSP